MGHGESDRAGRGEGKGGFSEEVTSAPRPARPGSTRDRAEGNVLSAAGAARGGGQRCEAAWQETVVSVGTAEVSHRRRPSRRRVASAMGRLHFDC